MTKLELDLLAASDSADLKEASWSTAEKIVRYFIDKIDLEIGDKDMTQVLDLVSQAVMFAYKIGSDTGEAIARDAKSPSEVIDVEFTVVEVK